MSIEIDIDKGSFFFKTIHSAMVTVHKQSLQDALASLQVHSKDKITKQKCKIG